jgi:hypothetical protein
VNRLIIPLLVRRGGRGAAGVVAQKSYFGVSDLPVCGAKVGFAEIFLMPQPPLLTRRGMSWPEQWFDEQSKMSRSAPHPYAMTIPTACSRGHTPSPLTQLKQDAANFSTRPIGPVQFATSVRRFEMQDSSNFEIV